ncbi:MAG: LuxR family transcriptional regulator [Rhodobacterales bacterium]|jgi:LuxR family transcriptional regulator, quorum-sensing system regulator SdiA|nr:LuxR family transcriptional regulator [Rhodobacterales bacterium]
MTVPDERRLMGELANSGYYLALRVGFAFPMEEVITFQPEWVEHYTRHRFMLSDPIIRWMYANSGTIRWSEIALDDPREVMRQARSFGLRFGVAVSCFDNDPGGQRSFGSFARSDREFSNAEVRQLEGWVGKLHRDKAPPTNLTGAEITALQMVRDGMRLKQVAHELGVTEGAVKQRLKNARVKLGAKTGAEAISRAAGFGLL